MNLTKKILILAVLAASATPALAQPAKAPAQGPQPITKAAFMQRIDSAFVNVDANKDGFTDRAELEAAETRAFAARKANGFASAKLRSASSTPTRMAR